MVRKESHHSYTALGLLPTALTPPIHGHNIYHTPSYEYITTPPGNRHDRTLLLTPRTQETPISGFRPQTATALAGSVCGRTTRQHLR
jgi:hypothetical protein